MGDPGEGVPGANNSREVIVLNAGGVATGPSPDTRSRLLFQQDEKSI